METDNKTKKVNGTLIRLIVVTRCLLLAGLLFIPLAIHSQTQQGVVRTALRPGKKVVYLEGVTIRLRDKNITVVSDKDGKFTIPDVKQGDVFYISQVRKNGYELADNRTIGRAFTYSPNEPIEIVMLNTREKAADVLRITNNVYRRAEKTYSGRLASLEKQLAEKTINEDEYRRKREELDRWYEKYESMINDMTERYASTDYAAIDSLNAAVNTAIENGDLELADSLISTTGSFSQKLKESIEAKNNALQRQKVAKEIIDKSMSDLAEKISDNDRRLGDLLYSKFCIYLAREKNDSASYCICLRAELDTTNVRWQLDAGDFICKYLAKYDSAMIFYQRALYSTFMRYGENSSYTAACYNNIGRAYALQDNDALALSYYRKASDIYKSLFGECHPVVAESYNNIGMAYLKQGKYSDANEYFQKAVTTGKKTWDAEDPEILKYEYNASIAAMKASSDNEDDYMSFMSDKVFTATVALDDSPAFRQGMFGENYILEFADWTTDGKENLFEKEEYLQGKPKTIVAMNNGMIKQYHFNGFTGIQLELKTIGKEEKEKITDTYNKWRKENGNRQ